MPRHPIAGVISGSILSLPIWAAIGLLCILIL